MAGSTPHRAVPHRAARRRHGLIGSGATVLVLLLLAVLLRFVWLPSWRPDLRPGERYAIDVSAHQGAVDWARVRRDGIDLAYVKATEGRDFVDARFRSNVTSARRAGIRTGVYHFFTLCTPGAEQAAHFRRTALDAGPLPPAVDLELAGNCAARPAGDDVARELAAFVSEVERWAGRPVVLYVGTDWRSRYGLPALPGPLWVRHLLFRPSLDAGQDDLRLGGDWSIWQGSAFARMDGIDGPVDLNVMRTELIPR